MAFPLTAQSNQLIQIGICMTTKEHQNLIWAPNLIQILLIALKDSKIIQVISRYPIHNVKHSSEMLQTPLNLAWKWPNYQQILKILMSHNFTNSKNKSWSWWRQIYRKLGSSKRVSTVPHMDGVKSSNYVLSPRSHKNDDWKPQHALDTRPKFRHTPLSPLYCSMQWP
jgi:hypothetical protein